ncbi:MAG: hypothetical protein ACREE0_23545 [Phenylobacterium sp.]
MRVAVSTLVIATAMALAAATAQAAPQTPAGAQQMAANSVERHAIQATYTGPQLEVGYSSSTRRIADCLASFPGYNPKTDFIWSRSGPKQRCKL